MRLIAVENAILKKTSLLNAMAYRRRTSIINTIIALLILLFMYASASKLANFTWYYGEMSNQPFPNWITPYLAWGIPIIEILISIGLMFNITRMLSFYASFILMISFTLYIGLILLNVFPYTPCSCGGVLRQLGWKNHFIFNLFFVIISFWGIVLVRFKPDLKNSS